MECTKDSQKNKKIKSCERLQKPLQLKNKKNKLEKVKKNKNEEEYQELKYPEPVEHDEILNKTKEEKRKNKFPSGKKRRNGVNREIEQVNQFNIEAGKSNEANDGTEKSKVIRNKKRKSEKIIESELSEIHKLHDGREDGFDEKNRAEKKEKKKSKLKKNKINSENIKEADIYKAGELDNEIEDGYNQQTGKSKKARNIKKKDQLSQDDDSLLEKRAEAEHDEVHEISSGDEDCSRGMKKWITEYHTSRPGVKILQERIDDFIVADEAQEEQSRKEREAQAAEGGWAVVVHHKGRKKTTDSESGITVGSVAQATVIDKMAKKKSKEVGLDFYRFQKRETQRNEIMMLQSKFEQDKKRIQQMRAARKFRPY